MIKSEEMKTETGVIIVKDGKAWGKTHSDGNSTSYGWMNIESAKIYSQEFVTKPTDVTYRGSFDERELSTGKIVRVRRTTNVELI